MIPKASFTKTALFLLSLVLHNTLFLQIPSQVVRETVVDRSTGSPLPGATIQLESPDFSKEVVSNAEGIFRITDVPVGRYSIEASFIGYEPYVIA